MSLVADYGSDISSSEEEKDVQNIETITTTTKKSSLSSLLPPPKSKRNGPVRIVVDLPKPVKDDGDDSDNDQISKKSKSSGSDLFALLPAPKRPVSGREQNSSTNKSTSSTTNKLTTSFVPHTLTKRKSVAKNSNLSQSFSKIKGKEVKLQSDEDETKDKTEDNNFTESFFPLGAEITNIIPSNVVEDESSFTDRIKSSNIESNVATENYNVTNDYYYNYNYQWDAGANSYAEYPEYYYDESQLQQQSSEQAQPDSQIDDDAIQKLGGRRGKEGPIVIKEISAADQMADAWQAQMGELTKPGKSGSGGAHYKPTKGQKRKHNLMYLAYQAAAMENDLKEQFAANKKTKRETQAKYGF